MNREEKAAVIDQIADELGAADAIFALDYRGITVAQIAELREKLRTTDTRLQVTKNSLSERAADQAGVADIKPLLVGPTALAMVKGDAAAAAKVLSDTARVLRGPLQFKGGIMGGAVLSATDVESIARLPSRDVLNAQLVGTIAAPLTGLARTLNALISGLAIQLGQVRDQGLVSGTAPAAEPAPAAAEPAQAAAEAAPAAAEPEATEPEAAVEAEAPVTEPETEPADAAEVSEADSPSAEETPDAAAESDN
jgi:large subunit ribosomal protein L10